ncbi:major facilitator superfamily domain-containing protein [Mortierella sp. GBAus27b]|nr:major facilitator superfamily domain-containing protein [Mortierella sp. GBAus27b]
MEIIYVTPTRSTASKGGSSCSFHLVSSIPFASTKSPSSHSPLKPQLRSKVEEMSTPKVTETTALLNGSSSAPTQDNHNLTSHGSWVPRYWAVIPITFLGGLYTAPSAIMFPPLLKVLFCERGIPALVAAHQGPAGSSDDGRCDSAEYSAAIAKFFSITVSIAAAFVTLTVRYWSSMGDRIGRKRVLLIWAIGMCAVHSITLIVYYVRGLSLYFLWLSGLAEGLSGSILSAISLVHAYAADVTAPEERTIVFGRVMAGYYGGLGLGAAWAGVVASKFGVIGVFWVIPALTLLNFLYIAIFLPSSASDDARGSGPLSNSHSNDTLVGSETPVAKYNTTISHRIRAAIHSFVPEQLPNRLGGKYSVAKVMVVSFLALVAAIGATYQIPTYLMFRFHWAATQISLFSTIQGMSRFVVLMVIVPLIKWYAPGGTATDPVSSIKFDLQTLVGAVFIESLTLLLFGVASFGELFHIGAVTGALGTIYYPTIRSILSKTVSPDLLGTTLGTVATFEAVSAVVSPPLTAWFYSITLETYPSAIFYMSAALGFLGWALALSVLYGHIRASVNL